MIKYLVFCGLMIKCAFGGYFDLSDIDPVALFWNAKHPSTSTETTTEFFECQVKSTIGTRHGICKPPRLCLLAGGTVNGFCGFLSTCCTYEQSCGKSTNSKISYFEGSYVQSRTSCKYTVKLKNPNVCQVRLDFIHFNLARTTVTNENGNDVFKCNNDKLTISPNHYNVPELCGNNDKQHVYIHVNQSDGAPKSINLEMQLADRSINTDLPSPYWKIKITQLECPGKLNYFDFPKKQEEEIAHDFHQLAPLGAIQYHTDTTGYIKSFGFEGTSTFNSYAYGQNYAIAFRRSEHICGVRFSPDYIYLPPDQTLQQGDVATDSNCYHYLFVPELYFATPVAQYQFVSRVCVSAGFTAHVPGPLYVNFNSNRTSDVQTDGTTTQGFNIKYELLNRC